MSAPELNRTVTISYAMLIMAATVIITATTTINKVLSVETAMEKQKEFILAEIDGLRSDMDKEDGLIRDEVKRVRDAGETRQDWMNARIDRKVKNHEAIYHGKK